MASTRKTLDQLTKPINMDPSDAVDTLLPQVLHPLILEYLLDDKTEEKPYQHQPQLTFIANVAAAYTYYATQINHNFLWNIKVDETLAFAGKNPGCLTVEVEIKDPHGQRLKAKTLTSLLMAGDTNPRKLKEDEKDYGLVERIRPCFAAIPDEYKKQLAEWQRDASLNETMKPYVNAIETLCQQIIDSKEITDYALFETYLDSPIANQFREALKPNPNNVITSGFLFSWQIFLEFFNIFEMNVDNKSRPNLGGCWSLKSDVFYAIVYPALQARVSRGDFPHFIKGIGNIEQKGEPRRLDFSNGSPEILAGLGRNFVFGFFGSKCGRRPTSGDALASSVAPRAARHFQNLYQAKTSLRNLQPGRSSPLRG